MKNKQVETSKSKIAIIGLGYVGLPLAVEFSKKYSVIGFDLNFDRISELSRGIDKTNELNKTDIKSLAKIKLTNNQNDLHDSNIYIITVPTPVDKNNKPDLSPLISASKIIAILLVNTLGPIKPSIN